MRKNVLKYIAGGVGLVVLAVGVLYSVRLYKYRARPEYRAEQYFKDLERRYREDPYGGSTPEETLQLFIEALKQGDIELAAKYFPPDEQAKWLSELEEVKTKGFLSRMIEELQKTKVTKREDVAYFTLVNEKNVVESQLVMRKNTLSSKWKIVEL